MESTDAALPIPLVSTAWLAQNLGRPGLAILDASWYLPSQSRDAGAEFRAGHLPGARCFDLDAASRADTDLPHMLPSPAEFADAMASLGVDNHTDVVVYDGSGNQQSAPRLWWMLRVFGHDRVAVLDGGIRKWRAEGRAVEGGVPGRPPSVAFAPTVRPALVRSRGQVEEALAHGKAKAVDARSGERFRGEVEEPRPGLRRGHLPGAANFPFGELVDPATGTYLTPGELRARLEASGLAIERPVIAYCGSGVTACSLALALELAGAADVAVYDGSWAEWGRVRPEGERED